MGVDKDVVHSTVRVNRIPNWGFTKGSNWVHKINYIVLLKFDSKLIFNPYTRLRLQCGYLKHKSPLIAHK